MDHVKGTAMPFWLRTRHCRVTVGLSEQTEVNCKVTNGVGVTVGVFVGSGVLGGVAVDVLVGAGVFVGVAVGVLVGAGVFVGVAVGVFVAGARWLPSCGSEFAQSGPAIDATVSAPEPPFTLTLVAPTV